MPGKRKFKDLDPQPVVHESRRIQVFGDRPKPAKKAKQIDFANRERTSAVNDLKKRIRDLRRKLERVTDLPANVRAEDERALAAYEQELVLAEQKKMRDACISKWHMVRFFERQKATRLVKKYKKQLLAAETEEEVEVYKRRLHIAEVDLNYTQYSPLAETYIGIFPSKKTRKNGDEDEDQEEEQQDGEDTTLESSRPPMWKEVEKAMEEGKLEKLRNRAPSLPIKPSKPPSKQSVSSKAPPRPTPAPKPAPQIDTTGLNRRERRKLLRGEEPASRSRTKIKSMSAGFEKNMAFGAEQAYLDRQKGYKKEEEEDNSDDGGFFE